MFSEDLMAEGEGFEPPVPFRAQRFSRPPVSTAHPSLRGGKLLLDYKLTAIFGEGRSRSIRSKDGTSPRGEVSWPAVDQRVFAPGRLQAGAINNKSPKSISHCKGQAGL
jgi:hypothetical protein